MTTRDPIAGLLSLADVRPALDEARHSVDSALAHRALRRSGGSVAAEAGLRDAVAVAALENRAYDREAVRGGLVADPLLTGALRVGQQTPRLVEVWRTAPRQALARLHTLAARDLVPDTELGRPGGGADVSARLAGLMDAVAGGTSAPGLLVAAVVHGELLALRAFAGPNTVVAGGAARLVLISTGLDPRGLLPLSVGHLAREPEYRGSAGAFATGTPDGVRSWLMHYARAVTAAAAELVAIGDEIVA